MVMLESTIINRTFSIIRAEYFGIHELCDILEMVSIVVSFSLVYCNSLINVDSQVRLYNDISNLNLLIRRSGNLHFLINETKINYKLQRRFNTLVYISIISQMLILIIGMRFIVKADFSFKSMIYNILTTLFYAFSDAYFTLITLQTANISFCFHGFLLKMHQVVKLSSKHSDNFELFRIFCDFKELQRSLSESQGANLLSVYIYTFSMSSGEMFFILTDILMISPIHRRTSGILDLLILVTWFLPIILILYEFSTTSTKNELFLRSLMKLNYDKHMESKGNLNYSEIVDDDELKCHASGLFTLDSSLLFKVSRTESL